jgi:hypothetical protein
MAYSAITSDEIQTGEPVATGQKIKDNFDNHQTRLNNLDAMEWRVVTSDSSGSYSNNTGSYTQVTNFSESITTSGKAVRITISAHPTLTSNFQGEGIIRIKRSTLVIAAFDFDSPSDPLPPMITFIDDNDGAGLSASTYTYSVEAINTGTQIDVTNCSMFLETLYIPS